jgi:Cdc6-like AAA superfamily ATPase
MMLRKSAGIGVCLLDENVTIIYELREFIYHRGAMSPGPTLFDDITLSAGEVWTPQQWGVAEASAKRLFNPRSPIDEEQLFSGRQQQVSDLLSVIYEKGAHAVLYGERGVGKSSLANVITSKIPPVIQNIKFLKENCRPEDSFFTLWAKMLWEFEYEGVMISEYLKEENRHFVLIKILESLKKDKQYVFIFDEFDRVSSIETKNAMADTIKHFSDYPQNITIVIVGVGLSIEELFGAHPSISRCCQQIPMPRMSKSELLDILDERYPKIGVYAGEEVASQLIDLSQGLPGFAHLAGREAVLSAIRRRERKIDKFDYQEAIRESVRHAQESIVSAYSKATYSAKENIYKEVLLACAMAETDGRGKFSASDIREALAGIVGRRIEIAGFARHLAAFCDPDRGPVLRKTGKPKRFQYQFVEAPLQPYVIMAGKKDGLI